MSVVRDNTELNRFEMDTEAGLAMLQSGRHVQALEMVRASACQNAA